MEHFELLPADFALSTSQLPPGAVLADVQQLMQPQANAISAQLCKLQISGRGSTMTSHDVDAPKSDGTFGSLVVCLPSAFEGGQLVLRREGAVHTFDWGKKQGLVDPTNGSEVTEAGGSMCSFAWVSSSDFSKPSTA